MPTYNKLVRDKIPQIIEATGKKFTTEILNDDDYIKHIKQKCYEELDEYCSAQSKEEAVEELADLLEVIHALANYHGFSMEEVEKVRKEKEENRGGFQEKIFLIEVEDGISDES
ncbi:nucleoside triphosphate pyrophosphohydrolase [Sutcliffiella horikoshii]|uniref:Nucleoside triphosphate pyrophosphohydrolase n=1 Tax=Sutcliffiella horikoshii TaxID=79883 RepID=A0AA95B5P9_9BACI|nr:nucleoside triphosphate pyrophosphohydrolase [Sutcliffiella horikoshii]TYS58539.1 nucleoside triphosphate pyrophosphohydrolase [Sutcliffiella horikoshii]